MRYTAPNKCHFRPRETAPGRFGVMEVITFFFSELTSTVMAFVDISHLFFVLCLRVLFGVNYCAVMQTVLSCGIRTQLLRSIKGKKTSESEHPIYEE